MELDAVNIDNVDLAIGPQKLMMYRRQVAIPAPTVTIYGQGQ